MGLGNFGDFDVALLADRLGLGTRPDRLRLGEGLGDRVDAEPILAADADERLGIDRAVEMIVQVGALGHGGEKGAERQRIGAKGIEGFRGALLPSRLGGEGWRLQER